MKLALLLTLSVGTASVALAQEAPAPAPVEDKKVCKRVADTAVGSNLRRGPTRICKKASEWRAEQEELQRDLDTMRNGNGSQAGSPSPAAGPDPSGF